MKKLFLWCCLCSMHGLLVASQTPLQNASQKLNVSQELRRSPQGTGNSLKLSSGAKKKENNDSPQQLYYLFPGSVSPVVALKDTKEEVARVVVGSMYYYSDCP